MGHYASEMDPVRYSPAQVAAQEKAYAQADRLREWWGDQGYDRHYRHVCPKCGADVRWNFGDATAAFLHMDFHAKLESYWMVT